VPLPVFSGMGLPAKRALKGPPGGDSQQAGPFRGDHRGTVRRRPRYRDPGGVRQRNRNASTVGQLSDSELQ
jgi:hypothetical protein